MTNGIMLILRGIAGHYDGKDWPRGALHEEPAKEYAELCGYDPEVLDVAGNTGPGSHQVIMAVARITHDPNVTALYGFSGGGYNIRHIWHILPQRYRNQIKKIVVLGASDPIVAVKASDLPGCPDVTIRGNPIAGHMAGPQAFLDWARGSHDNETH